MNILKPSPIQQFESRLLLLSPARMAAFSAFCAQAAVGNIDVYSAAIGQQAQLFHDRLDSWFWTQLRGGSLELKEDYSSLENQLVELAHKLAAYPFEHDISPPPNSVMARESIFLFISACSFFSGQGRVAQLLTVLNNCVSCKVDSFYATALNLPVYAKEGATLDEVYGFPTYKHATADIEWVLLLLERDTGDWISDATLDAIIVYSKNMPTLVVPRPFGERG